MEPTPENLTTLSQCFLQSLAADPEPRKKAEAFLRSASSQAGFGITVLTLVATAGVDEQVKQAAAVNFKNFVKFHWSPKDTDQIAHAPIQVICRAHYESIVDVTVEFLSINCSGALP